MPASPADGVLGAEVSAAAEPRRGVARPMAGWRIVARKELGDHVTSARFLIVLGILALVGFGTVYSVSGDIRDAGQAASGLPGVFLLAFVVKQDRLPSFLDLVGLLAPLLGIAFGFDAVSGERAQRTLPRLVSQPIHRDDIVNGKFAGALAVIGIGLGFLATVVTGLAIVRLGLVPTAVDLVRLVIFLLITVVYVGFWLGLAITLSVATRRAATAALAALGVWLVVTLFLSLVTGAVADAVKPVATQGTEVAIATSQLDNARFEQNLSRISPRQLYDEASQLVLTPLARSSSVLSVGESIQAAQANPDSSLSLEESLLQVWVQVVLLVAATAVLFVAAYVLFMRQEIRA
jgi:ABC-2 type transport system permease protein